MTTAIARAQTPEDRAYAQYLVEIEARKRRVAELQAEIEALRLALGRFEAEYHARVGVLFVELDRVRLQIAEYERRIALLESDLAPDPAAVEHDIDERFREQREEVRAEEEETRRYERVYQRERELPRLDRDAEDRAKRLYCELAKRFHPDLARTEEERRQREAMMQRVNAAFHARDLSTLEAMRAEAEVTDAAFEERSIGDKLVWAIREVARLDGITTALESDLAAIKKSDTHRLWQQDNGGDRVIEQLEASLKNDIEREHRRLAALIGAYRELVEARI